MQEKRTYAQIMSSIQERAKATWPGDPGEQRAKSVTLFIEKITTEYSQTLGLTKEEVLDAIESKRNYSTVNYYQEANFPSLDKVKVYENLTEFYEKVGKLQFRCPSCNGVSNDAYECSCEGCDWKSFGVFGTMGKGLKLIIKDKFIEDPKVHEIFMPVSMENEVAHV